MNNIENEWIDISYLFSYENMRDNFDKYGVIATADILLSSFNNIGKKFDTSFGYEIKDIYICNSLDKTPLDKAIVIYPIKNNIRSKITTNEAIMKMGWFTLINTKLQEYFLKENIRTTKFTQSIGNTTGMKIELSCHFLHIKYLIKDRLLVNRIDFKKIFGISDNINDLKELTKSYKDLIDGKIPRSNKNVKHDLSQAEKKYLNNLILEINKLIGDINE